VRDDKEEPLPEKLPEQQPEPEQPPQPQPKPEPKANMKSVDFEIDKEEEPSPEAKFLAEKNNRAEQETRAERTNLEKEQRGEAPSQSPSDRKDTEEGDPDDKVARLEDQKSKRGREAPRVTPHQKQSLAQSAEDERKSMLRMRETTQRRHEVSPETADNSLPRDPEGVRAMPDSDLQAMKDMPGRSGQSSSTSLRLSSQQYQYLFGEDAEAAERFAQTEKSRKQGRFSKHISRVMAALENFIPEVRPGNQTELNTRAAPFAAFIARMHRSIHERWGFGFLEDLASRPMSDPHEQPGAAHPAGDRPERRRHGGRGEGDPHLRGYGLRRRRRGRGLQRRPVPGSAVGDPLAQRQDLRALVVSPRRTAVRHLAHGLLHPGQPTRRRRRRSDRGGDPHQHGPAPAGRFRPGPMASGSPQGEGEPSGGSSRASRGEAESEAEDDGEARRLRRLAGPEGPSRAETMPEGDVEASRRVERERANANDPEAQAWPTIGSSRSCAATCGGWSTTPAFRSRPGEASRRALPAS
jgi:hypothetical protein